MSAFVPLLRAMQDSILSGDVETGSAAIREKPDFPATEQLAIYIEGYRLRLLGVIRSHFKALEHYLGQEKFERLAALYIERTPSRHYNIDRYPIGFAVHMQKETKNNIAAALAQVEEAILIAYGGEETPAFNPAALPPAKLDQLPSLPLKLRGACLLLALPAQVEDYITAFRTGTPANAPKAGEEFLAVCRHNNKVRRLKLEKQEFALLSLFREGISLEQALESDASRKANTPEQMQAWFARWAAEGLLSQPA